MARKNKIKTSIKILVIAINLIFTFVFFNGNCTTTNIKEMANKKQSSLSNKFEKSNLHGDVLYNLITGDPCFLLNNSEKNTVINRLFQFDNIMLSISSYDKNSKDGEYSCTSNDYLEPFLTSGKFTCKSSGITFKSTNDLQTKCRPYRSKEIKCSQFNDNFQQDITQVNVTRFKHNSLIFAFDQQESNQKNNVVGSIELSNLSNLSSSQNISSNTLSNPLLMSAISCSIANNSDINAISETCLNSPNNPSCYGKFSDQFVHFPETYFPTYEGSWDNYSPGYQGNNKLPEDLDFSTWSYFEFNSIGAHHRLMSSVGVRFDPTINLQNFKGISSKTMATANPQNPGNLPQLVLSDFGQISSYFYQAARSEVLSMTSQNRKGVPQYYYDHIPRQFKGFGAVLNSYKNSGVFTPGSNHQFQAFCDNGCRRLVITSHETCDNEYSEVPSNTEVHCLPKFLSIRINHLERIDPEVFHINGYESVEIKDLVISIAPSTKPLEIREATINDQVNVANYLDYLLPRLSFYFLPDGSIKNFGLETDRNDFASELGTNHIFNFNPILHEYTFTSFDDYARSIPNWILAKGESQHYGPIQLASLIKLNEGKSVFNCYDPYLNIDSSSSMNLKACPGAYANNMACISNEVRNTCGAAKLLSSLVGNLMIFKPQYFNSLKKYFTLQKRGLLISDVDKLVISNFLYRGITQGGIASEARKNIFHGNHFEGYKLGDLINRGLPIDSSNIGITNYYGLSVGTVIDFNSLYFAPSFIITGNNEGHVRLDETRRALFPMDYPSEYPSLYNLCKALNGSNPNSQYCDSQYNFKASHTFSAEEYFSPFYYATDAPEERANKDGIQFNHYSNDLYLKKFNPSLKLNFLISFDKDPISPPMVTNEEGQRVINNYDTCSANSDCGRDGYCHQDNLYSNGICLQGDLRTKYVIVSNSTFQKHSFRWIDFMTYGSSDSRDSYNHDFISTNGSHALIFNNILRDSASDIYDFNFRATHYRSEANKNLIQVIERNIIANGTNGKTTGEGNPESKMRYSNNIIKDVRIGGYHGFFKPFYLNNTLLSGALSILNDTQNGFLNVESLKPYGVRHALFNNAVIRSNPQSVLISSGNIRAKQHSFDYNFSHNMYFGEFSGLWFTGMNPANLSIGQFNKNLPILNFDYGTDNFGNNLGCINNVLLSSIDDSSCNSPVSIDLAEPSELTDIFRGSFTNYIYNSSKNNGFNFGRLSQIDLETGETVLYGHSPNLDNFNLNDPTIDATSPRIDFVSQYCFNLEDSSAQHDPTVFSSVNEKVADSYTCITGDNTSKVFTQNELNSSNFDIYHAVNSAFELTDNDDMTRLIIKNLGREDDSCNAIEDQLSKNKTPSVIVNNKGLSVYRDFKGHYRSPASSSGAFDIHCPRD